MEQNQELMEKTPLWQDQGILQNVFISRNLQEVQVRVDVLIKARE